MVDMSRCDTLDPVVLRLVAAPLMSCWRTSSVYLTCVQPNQELEGQAEAATRAAQNRFRFQMCRIRLMRIRLMTHVLCVTMCHYHRCAVSYVSLSHSLSLCGHVLIASRNELTGDNVY